MEDTPTERRPIVQLDDQPQLPMDLPSHQPLQRRPGMPGRALWGENCPTNAPRMPRYDSPPTTLLPTGQRPKPLTQLPQKRAPFSSTMPHLSFICSTMQTKHCWLTCTPKPTTSSIHVSCRCCKDTTQPNCHAVNAINGDTSNNPQHL
jgi:hypothetical protein